MGGGWVAAARGWVAAVACLAIFLRLQRVQRRSIRAFSSPRAGAGV